MTSQDIKEAFKKKSGYTRRKVESSTQQASVLWFNAQYNHLKGLLFAVPNEGKRSKATSSRMSAEGMVSGVFDMILLIPMNGYGSLCVEFKAKDGYLSPKQREWRDKAERMGNKAVVCRSVDEFIREVNEYLG
jgi:hypothetical protein